MSTTKQAAEQAEAFTPVTAVSVDLRKRPYPSKAHDPVTKEPIMVDGLALVINGDVKIDYFGKYGGWEKWQALGEAFTLLADEPELARKIGKVIQRTYIKHLAHTNGTKRDVGESLLG